MGLPCGHNFHIINTCYLVGQSGFLRAGGGARTVYMSSKAWVSNWDKTWLERGPYWTGDHCTKRVITESPMGPSPRLVSHACRPLAPIVQVS